MDRRGFFGWLAGLFAAPAVKAEPEPEDGGRRPLTLPPYSFYYRVDHLEVCVTFGSHAELMEHLAKKNYYTKREA